MGEATRIVILGNDGVGKSSLANSIFGEDAFSVNDSPNNQNKNCQSKCKKIDGKDVQLVEFPGVFNANPRSKELSPELLKCFTECAPGPHAFLLVLKVGRFTAHDKAVVDIIQSYFTEDALKYTTVVFTHGEDLPKGMKIEDWVKQNEALKNLVQKCEDRCHAIDNKHWNEQEQVKELLVTVNTMIRGKKTNYTNEMLTNIHRDIEKEKESIRRKQVNKLPTDFKGMVLKSSIFPNEMGENAPSKNNKLMREKPLESLPSTAERMSQSRYTNEELDAETLTCAALLLKARVAVLKSLILSLGRAALGVLLGAFLGVAAMLAVVTITSPSLLHYILGLLAVAGGIFVGVVTGGILALGLAAGLASGLAGGFTGGFLWSAGAGSLIWMESLSMAREVEIRLKILDELYEKLSV